MELTVADVLELPVVSAGRPNVRVGGAGLRAPVRWVHVSELTEVAGTLRGGELILSTGMGLRQNDFDGPAYFRSLREAGAVGLVVELGQHVQRLDDDLVRAARAARLPLVELARNVRFVAVTEAVHALILNDQYERLRFSERVHGEFSALSLGTATAEQVLERAANLIGRPVVLEDLGHHAVSFAGGPGEEVLLDWNARSRRASTSVGASSTTTGGPEGWSSTPVGPVGERWGRLVVPQRVDDGTQGSPDRQAVFLVLERAAEALTVVRLIDRDARSVTERAAGGLLRQMIGGNRGDESELRSRARALGLPLRGVYAPVVLAPMTLAPEGADVTGSVARSLELASVAALVGPIGAGQVGVLLSVADEAALVRALSHVTTRLGGEVTAGGSLSPSTPMVVATADPAPTLAEAGEGLLEAAHVARVAAHLPAPVAGKIYRSGDLGTRGLLWWMRDDPRLQTFVEGQLGPLLGGPRADAEIDLLRRYLDCGGSVTRVAEGLHISRPATYARLERLQAGLGRRLDDAETRLSLHLALLARELLAR